MAAALWTATHQDPTYRVECSVSEVYATGAKTPRGSFTIVLEPDSSIEASKGFTPLQGTWSGDPTLSARIIAVDTGQGKFPVSVDIENRLETPEYSGAINVRENGSGSPSESRDDFTMQLAKADSFGGHYEFEFHRKGGPWYRAFLP
jgi:hypothetical protein